MPPKIFIQNDVVWFATLVDYRDSSTEFDLKGQIGPFEISLQAVVEFT